jgi:hypothetical protein
VAIIAAFDVTLRVVYALVAGIGFPELTPGGTLPLPSAMIGMSVGLLAALLAGAKGMELAVRSRSGHLPPLPVRARVLRRRLLLQGAGVLVAAWFPLLGFGVAGLSPLSDGVVSRPKQAVGRSAGADVAGSVSARKRRVDSTGVAPIPEASAAPIADGSDGSSPALSSGGEGAGALDPPSVPGNELVEQAPEYEAEGEAGGNGQVAGTGGVAVSRETRGERSHPDDGRGRRPLQLADLGDLDLDRDHSAAGRVPRPRHRDLGKAAWTMFIIVPEERQQEPSKSPGRSLAGSRSRRY